MAGPFAQPLVVAMPSKPNSPPHHGSRDGCSRTHTHTHTGWLHTVLGLPASTTPPPVQWDRIRPHPHPTNNCMSHVSGVVTSDAPQPTSHTHLNDSEEEHAQHSYNHSTSPHLSRLYRRENVQHGSSLLLLCMYLLNPVSGGT